MNPITSKCFSNKCDSAQTLNIRNKLTPQGKKRTWICLMSWDVTLLIHSLVNVQVTLVHAASLETCWMVCLMSWQGGIMLNYPFKMSNRVLGLGLTRSNSYWQGRSCMLCWVYSGRTKSVQNTWHKGFEIRKWHHSALGRSCLPPGHRVDALEFPLPQLPLPLLSPPSCQWTVNQ